MAFLKALRMCVPQFGHSLRASAPSSAAVSKKWQGQSKHQPFWICSRPCQTISTNEWAFPMNVDHQILERLMDTYDTFLLDCDGVLWGIDHHTKFRNIDKTINKLRDCGKQLIFVTNNSMHTREVYLEKFKIMCNFEAAASDVFSVCYAAALYLKTIAKVQGKVYAIGSKGMADELDSVGLENIGYGTDQDPISDFRDDLLDQNLDPDVQAVLVGFDIHIGYNKIYKAASYLSNQDCIYVATNDVETRVTIGPNRIQPLTGVITEAVNAASSRKPIVIGKPHSHLLACVLSTHPDIDLSRTVMIGDSMKTDVSFANNSGIDSVLVMSGATSPRDLKQYQSSQTYDMPTYTMDSFSMFGEVL